MEPISYVRALLALIFVLALIGLLTWALRRWQASGGTLSKKMAGDRRLQLVEQFYFEPKRRLVLMRCDDTEHLILLGHQRETLISSRTVKEGEAHAEG